MVLEAERLKEEKVADQPERQEIVKHLSRAGTGMSLIEMGEDEFSRMKGIATSLAQAGVFKDVSGAPVAFAKMVIGRELGLGIGQSMLGLHLVEGGVQMHYSTMLSCVRAHGYKYRIPEHTEDKCVIEWIDPDGELVGVTEYTMADAEKAEIFTVANNGKKTTPRGKSSMYEKVPKNMLLARCVSNGVKAYVPEALGGMPLYVTDEPLMQSRVVDGSSEVDTVDPVSLSAVAADVPEDLRDRFYAAYGQAAHTRPGTVSPAAVQMNVRGQSHERVVTYLETMEADNERALQDSAAEVTDADVVESEDLDEGADPAQSDSASPQADEAAGEAESPPLVHAPEIDVEALGARLSELHARVVESAEEQEAKDEEIDYLESELRRAAAAVPPGQEKLL